MRHRHGVYITFVTLVAIVFMAAGCSQNPDEAKRKHMESGDRYFQAEKYDAALIEYRNAVQKDPRFGDARFKLAQTYLHRGDASNALRESVRAADLLPERADAQLQAIRLLLVAGRFADARTRAEALLKREPRNVEAEIARGNALAGLQDLEGAVAQIEEAVKLDPNRSGTYSTLGALRAARGDMRAAEEAFNEAVARGPRSAVVRLTLAQFYWQTGRPDQAEAAMKDALALDPKGLITNRMIAAFYQAVKKPDAAEPFLRAAMEADPSPGGKLALADYYIARNRPSDALPILDTLMSNPKVASTAQTRRAVLYARAGDLVKAEQEIQAVLAKEPKNIEALLVRTDFLLSQKKLDEALAAADKAIAADARSVPAQFVRGRIMAATDRPEEAKKAFNEVLRLNPRVDAAQTELARLHLKTGATETSVSLAAEAVKINPRSLDARLVLARGLMTRRDLAQAGMVLKELIDGAPDVAAVHSQMGMLLALRNDPKGATKEFERALELDPLQLDAVGGLVGLDATAGRVAQAKGRMETLIARAPRNMGVLLLAGRTFLMLKDASRAETLLVQAIEINPNALAAYAMLGQIYLMQGRLAEARSEFEKLAAKQSPPVGALTMVGIIEQMQNRQADAKRTFERVVQLDSRAAVAANNLAWIYADGNENLDLALQLAQTAKAAMPEQSEINDTLGWVYYRKGLLPQAIRALQHGVQLQPKNPTYHYHLGLALARNGDNAEARRALETALKLNPSFDGAPEASAAIASLRGSADARESRQN